MANTYELRAILNDAAAIAALQRYYERGWDRILAALALGVARPSALRTRELLAKLRSILATLDPAKNPEVRHWIRDWVRKSFAAGEDAAAVEIEHRKPSRSDSSIASATMANAAAVLEHKLSMVASSMSALVTAAYLAINQAVLNSPLLRSGTSIERQVGQDLQGMILNGPDPITVGRLARNGISRATSDVLRRVNAGIIQIGKAAVSLPVYVKQAAQDVLAETHNAASVLVGQKNDVDHVLIGKEETRNICIFCSGVEFRVFYSGTLPKDPAGFPRLQDLPPGPKWHPNCVHILLPWDISAKSQAEINSERAASLAIPAAWFGPQGTVEKVNSAKFKHLRKLA